MEWRGVLVVICVALSAVHAATEAVSPKLLPGSRATRIVSGWEASPGQFPYQLSLRMVNPAGGATGCGGSIIHTQWGLTVANCIAGQVTIVVRAGGIDLSRPELIFETTEFYTHPLYNDNLPTVQANDIGLINFGRNIQFNDRIQPIRIQRSRVSGFNFNRVRMFTAGWGTIWTNGASPERLNWVYLRGITNDECQNDFGALVQSSTICTRGFNVTSQSICQGDVGGALASYDDDGRISQVAVASFVSVQGCHVNIPAGYVRTGFYHDWYTQVTGINFDWELENFDPNCVYVPAPPFIPQPVPNCPAQKRYKYGFIQ